MEATPHEEVTNMNSNTNSYTNAVLKGKRTKRQRVQSPIPFALTANSSSGEVEAEGENCTNINNVSMNISLTTTSQEFQESSTTEEEEDMANCLILLAQGNPKNTSKLQDDDQELSFRVYNSKKSQTKSIIIHTPNSKFNSRKFLETGSSGSGKAGYYVYECKTCNRTFPTFQALGGHRASHKPKIMSSIKDENFTKNHTNSFGFDQSDDEDGNYRDISSLSLQISTNTSTNSNKKIYQNKSKIHECSICGAEFNSGQALGGHMRRHRGSITSSNSTVMNRVVPVPLSLTQTTMNRIEESEEQPNKARSLLSLDLDLNLPAPDDEKQQMPFASKQQQQQQEQQQQPKSSLVFSSQTLVDCHY